MLLSLFALMASGTLISQINLQKKDVCNIELVGYIQEKQLECHSLLIGIQEPNITEKKMVSFLPDRNLIYHRSNDRPRAALFATNGLNLVPNSAYMDKDMATALWITKDDRVPYIMVTSVYMDGTDKTLPEKLEKLVGFCSREGLELIILADSNSHSPFFGGDETNGRGELMELFILQHNLVVLNRGSLPDVYTYYREEGRIRTIPDVTLCTFGLEDYLSDWIVTWSIRASDHRLMEMHLNLDVLHEVYTRNFSRDTWDTFQRHMSRKSFPIRSTYTVEQLEADASYFTDAVISSLDASHPKKKVALKLPDLHWWNQDVEKAKKEKRIAQNNWRNNGRTEELKAIYDAKRKAYCKLQRSARRKCWQEWVSSRYDFAKVAHFSKVLNRKSFNQLGLLVDSDGEPCRTAEDSLQKLLTTHFPDCVDVEDRVLPPIDGSRVVDVTESEVCRVFTDSRTDLAFDSFGDNKAAGFDEIKPLVLKRLEACPTSFLTNLFRASYLLSYVPTSWRNSKVIFIPKPGKDSYCVPRSWRPISLMSFILKAMERVVLWELQNKVFIQRPLNTNQHAFRKGRSTESALSNVVEYAENALINRGYMLSVSLDIQGAFDNVTTEGMIEGLRAKGVNEQMVQWYLSCLQTRTITAEYKGASISKAPTKGTPQGGVLSPVMWNLAFESFIELFPDSGNIKCTVFADDAMLCIAGDCPVHLVNQMQRGLNTSVQWGDDNGLHFAPEKTVAMMFTRKSDDVIPNVKVGDYMVPYSRTARYLGVQLDDKLEWTDHINLKCKNSKALLYRVRRASGALWGLGPLMSCWFYRAMVRPVITYGVGVWCKGLNWAGSRRKLEKVQRVALMSMGHFRPSTPTAGLEVATYTMPLWLHCMQEACMSFIRTKQLTKFRRDEMYINNAPKLMGHRQFVSEFMESIGFVDFETDNMTEVQVWERKCILDRESFTDGTPNGDGHIQIYTDGSKQDSGLSGAGCAVLKGSVQLATDSCCLGGLASVFQCEIYALKMAAQYILDNSGNLLGEDIVIYSDSQAALLALNSHKVTSKIVQDTLNTFGRIDPSITVHLRWVKAHVGHHGNELADQLANDGSADLEHVRGDGPIIPFAGLRNQLNEAIVMVWMVEWLNEQPCRQTKHFFPTVIKKLAQACVRLSRKEFSVLIQFITGHNFMRRHQSIVDLGYPEMDICWCRYCDDGEESTYHLMSECDAFANERRVAFGHWELEPPYEVTPGAILEFLRLTKIEAFMEILSPTFGRTAAADAAA